MTIDTASSIPSLAHPSQEAPPTGGSRSSRSRSAGSAPLSRERRVELTAELFAEAAATNDEARRDEIYERIVLANMGVARTIASRHRDKGVPRDDLDQVAYLALTKAVRRFDPSLHHEFLSYAVPTIRGELCKYFRDLGWFIRPPRRVQETQSRVVAERDNLKGAGGRPVTAQEIADSLGEDVATVEEALAAQGCFTPTSLDLPVHNDGVATIGDELADEGPDGRSAAEARVVLSPVVRRLSERDRKILQMRFFEDRTQQEVADAIGVTQMQVSRLLARILRDLRGWLEEEQAEQQGQAGQAPGS